MVVGKLLKIRLRTSTVITVLVENVTDGWKPVNLSPLAKFFVEATRMLEVYEMPYSDYMKVECRKFESHPRQI